MSAWEALIAAFLVKARGCGMAGLGYIYIVAQELLADIVIGHALAIGLLR
jgi:hypothetical protein